MAQRARAQAARRGVVLHADGQGMPPGLQPGGGNVEGAELHPVSRNVGLCFACRFAVPEHFAAVVDEGEAQLAVPGRPVGGDVQRRAVPDDARGGECRGTRLDARKRNRFPVRLIRIRLRPRAQRLRRDRRVALQKGFVPGRKRGADFLILLAALRRGTLAGRLPGLLQHAQLLLQPMAAKRLFINPRLNPAAAPVRMDEPDRHAQPLPQPLSEQIADRAERCNRLRGIRRLPAGARRRLLARTVRRHRKRHPVQPQQRVVRRSRHFDPVRELEKRIAAMDRKFHVGLSAEEPDLAHHHVAQHNRRARGGDNPDFVRPARLQRRQFNLPAPVLPGYRFAMPAKLPPVHIGINQRSGRSRTDQPYRFFPLENHVVAVGVGNAERSVHERRRG